MRPRTRSLVVPFRGFGCDRQGQRRHRRDPPSLGIDCSFRVYRPTGTAVIGSAIPLRRWPFLGLMVFPCRAPPNSDSKNAADALFEFRLPPESFPIAPSTPHRRDNAARTSLGLCLPSAHSRLGGPLAAGLPRPLRSAFRVWLPSWQLTPPGPAPALFHADSAPGIPPFGAFPCRKVSRVLPPAMNPPAVSLAVVPSDGRPPAGPASLGSWALTLPEVPCRPQRC